MNARRRKELDRAIGLVQEAMDIVENAAGEEREYAENMPENLQLSDKWADAESVADELDDILGELDELQARIGDCREGNV
ncbi:MAG: hypothetical protein SPL79_02200 [Sphaerochaetaceae bacterium]|nr:hypothetical protein [Sphaerochaetaceae bacterium]